LNGKNEQKGLGDFVATQRVVAISLLGFFIRAS
jgi:hypothetical protein